MGIPAWVTVSVQGDHVLTALSPGPGTGTVITMPVSFPMPVYPGRQVGGFSSFLKDLVSRRPAVWGAAALLT